MSSSELLSLPDECLANIFSFVQQPLFLSLTCRRVYAITQNLSARANWLETQFCSTRFRLHMWLELAARPRLCTPGFLQLLTESRKHVPHAELAQLVLRYDPACSISADFSFLPNVRCLYKISKGRAAVAAHALEIARKSCREPEHPSFKTFTDAFRAEQLSETRPSALADSVGHREFHGHLSSTCEHLNGPLFGLPDAPTDLINVVIANFLFIAIEVYSGSLMQRQADVIWVSLAKALRQGRPSVTTAFLGSLQLEETSFPQIADAFPDVNFTSRHDALYFCLPWLCCISPEVCRQVELHFEVTDTYRSDFFSNALRLLSSETEVDYSSRLTTLLLMLQTPNMDLYIPHEEQVAFMITPRGVNDPSHRPFRLLYDAQIAMEPLCSRQFNVRQLTRHQRERNKAVFERAAESAVQRLLETTDASRLSDFGLLDDWEDVFPIDKLPSFSVRALLLLDVILTSPHFDLCQRSKPGFSSAVLSSQRRTLKGGNRWLSVALSLCNREGWLDQNVIRLILCNPACWTIQPVLTLLSHPKLQWPPGFDLDACFEHCTRHLVHIPSKGSHLLELVAKRPNLRAVIEQEVLSLSLKQLHSRQQTVTALGWWPNMADLLPNASATVAILSTSAYQAPSTCDKDPRAWLTGLTDHDIDLTSETLKKLLPSQYLPVSVALLSLFPIHSEVLQVALSHLAFTGNSMLLERYSAWGVPNAQRFT